MTNGDINHLSDTIFFSGCSVGCEFCFNKDLWVQKDKDLMSSKEIISFMSREYICLIGGEPCEQDIDPLVDKLFYLDKKVILFTSHTNNLPCNCYYYHIDLKPFLTYNDFRQKESQRYSFGAVATKELKKETLNMWKHNFNLTINNFYIKGSNKIQVERIVEICKNLHIKYIVGEKIHV